AAVVGAVPSTDDELSRQWLNTSAELRAAVEAAIREKYGVAPPAEG
ncbi:MAG: hypothetical protein RLZ04_740, partial [Actinomycetota bacterium]